MNIVFTITAYPPSTGGAQLHTHMLAQYIQNQHPVNVITIWDNNRTDWLLGITLRAPSTHKTYVIDQIPVQQLGIPLREKIRFLPYVALYYPWMSYSLPQLAKRYAEQLSDYTSQADIIHNIRTGREVLSYASFNVARKRDIPFVFTPIHHPRWVGWRYRAYIQLYRMADLLFALTDAEKQILISFDIPEEKITVIGIGPVLAEQANSEEFFEMSNIDGPFVLFLGQNYSYKGYRQMLQAAPMVWKKVPNAHFVFIGPPVGQSEQVYNEMKDRRIHRLGKVDLQQKTNALAACTLLCVPSTQESFGGVYTEAWSFAKPVIGCNIPAVSEVITDGVDGYLVLQEPKEIADRICHLLLNPSQAESMGNAGKQKVEEKYTWEKISQRVQNAYRLVV